MANRWRQQYQCVQISHFFRYVHGPHYDVHLYQKKEREDRFFVKQCLFCRHVEKTSRYDYLTHLSYQHNLQLGIPDNLVFIDKLLDKLEEKLNK